MADHTILTAARLRELLHYDPETGQFRRYRDPVVRRRHKVGCIFKGYLIIGISVGSRYRKYRAHRLAWLWMTGEWPALNLDHFDRNPLNNRWLNLREATASVNNSNRRSYKWKR